MKEKEGKKRDTTMPSSYSDSMLLPFPLCLPPSLLLHALVVLVVLAAAAVAADEEDDDDDVCLCRSTQHVDHFHISQTISLLCNFVLFVRYSSHINAIISIFTGIRIILVKIGIQL